MLKRTLVILAATITISFTSGCSTLADARAEKGTGISREYSAPIDVVWNAIPTVLAELSLPLVGQNREEGYILAQRGVSAFSDGENIAIFADVSSDPTKTRVEVVSKKAVATNIFAPNWGKDILEKLSEKLK